MKEPKVFLGSCLITRSADPFIILQLAKRVENTVYANRSKSVIIHTFHFEF